MFGQCFCTPAYHTLSSALELSLEMPVMPRCGILIYLLIFLSIWMECSRQLPTGCPPSIPWILKKIQNSAKLCSAFLKSRVYTLLPTLLTPLSILKVIVSWSLKPSILLNISPPTASSFLSSTSGKLNSWLAHLASILGSYVWPLLETSWLVGLPLCCLCKKCQGD